jgi:hypothetical protein
MIDWEESVAHQQCTDGDAASWLTMLLLLGSVQPINAQATNDQAKQQSDEQIGKALADADSDRNTGRREMTQWGQNRTRAPQQSFAIRLPCRPSPIAWAA